MWHAFQLTNLATLSAHRGHLLCRQAGLALLGEPEPKVAKPFSSVKSSENRVYIDGPRNSSGNCRCRQQRLQPHTRNRILRSREETGWPRKQENRTLQRTRHSDRRGL